MPTTPYLSPAEFIAHPTYLDVDDLRSGITDPAAQAAELTNVLLMASAWADGFCHQPLGAHQVVQNTRGRFDRNGNLLLHAHDGPVLSVSSVAYGLTPTSLTTVSSPTVWLEESQNILVSLTQAWFRPGTRVFSTLTYLAGWVSTQLTASALVGATSLTVADPTGIVPGGQYRLWEPGSEETVTVSSSFVPPAVTVPPAATAVTLAAPTLFAHGPGAGWSGMPADMRLAVISYAVAALMRPDTSAEDAYPDTPMASGTRQNDPRRDGSGLVTEAERILTRYQRIR